MTFGGEVQVTNSGGTIVCTSVSSFGPSALTLSPSGSGCDIEGAGLVAGFIPVVSPVSTPEPIAITGMSPGDLEAQFFDGLPVGSTADFTYLVALPSS